MVSQSSNSKRFTKWHYLIALFPLLTVCILTYCFLSRNENQKHSVAQTPAPVLENGTPESKETINSTPAEKVTSSINGPSIAKLLKTQRRVNDRISRITTKLSTHLQLTQVATNHSKSNKHEETLSKFSWNYPNKSVSTWLSPRGIYIALQEDEGGETIGVYHCRTGKLLNRFKFNTYVSNVAFSPDGKCIAASAGDQKTKIFDILSGSQIYQITHQGGTRSAVFSPDGKFLISSSPDGTMKILDLRAKKLIRTIRTDGWVSYVAFSPNGEYFAAHTGNRIRIYSFPKANLIGQISNVSFLRSLFFLSDKKQLVALDSDNLIVYQINTRKIISKSKCNIQAAIDLNNNEIALVDYKSNLIKFSDISTNRIIGQLSLGSGASHMTLSPDGESIIIANTISRAPMHDSIHHLKFYHKSSKKHISTLNISGMVNNISFSSDNKFVICATDTSVSFIPVSNMLASDRGATLPPRELVKKQLWSFPGSFNLNAISPYNDLIALTSQDGRTFIVYQLYTSKILRSWNFTDPCLVTYLEFSPSGNLISYARDRRVFLFDLIKNTNVAQSKSRDGVFRMKFTRNSKYLVTNCYKHRVKLLDIERDQPIGAFRHSMNIVGMDISNLGGYVATWGDDKTAKLFSIEQHSQQLATLAHEAQVNSGTFSPLDDYLATSGDDGKVILYDIAHRKEKAILKHDAKVNSVAFSPDGVYLTAACDDGTIILYDIEQGKQRSIKTKGKKLDSIFFTSNNQYIIATGLDGSVSLYDVARAEIFETLWHTESIMRALLSPDGTILATLSSDRTIFIYDFSSKKSIGMIQHSSAVKDLRFSFDGKSLIQATARELFSTTLN